MSEQALALAPAPELATAAATADALPPSTDAGFDFSKLESQGVNNDGSPAKENPASRKPEPAPKPEVKPAEPKPEVKPAAEVKPDAAKPDAAVKPAEAGSEVKPDKPLTGWQFGRQKEKEAKELQTKLEAAEARAKQLESKPHTPADDPERQKLAARLEELESEIRFVNYEKSAEFRDKYQQPYQKKAQELTKEAGELIVDRPDGTFTAMTSAEFWDVVTAPSLNDAVKAARALFPEDHTKANQVLAMRKEVKASWDSMQQAKEEYRTKGAEREKQNQLQEQQKRQQQEHETKAQAEARQSKWAEMNDAALKNPNLKEFFQAADDDAKGKELLTKGLKAADRAFGVGDRDTDGNLLGDDGKPVSEDDLIALHSVVRNKAGAFNYVANRYRAANARIAELEKELEQFRGSQPTGGKPAADKPANGDGGAMEDRFESMFKG